MSRLTGRQVTERKWVEFGVCICIFSVGPVVCGRVVLIPSSNYSINETQEIHLHVFLFNCVTQKWAKFVRPDKVASCYCVIGVLIGWESGHRVRGSHKWGLSKVHMFIFSKEKQQQSLTKEVVVWAWSSAQGFIKATFLGTASQALDNTIATVISLEGQQEIKTKQSQIRDYRCRFTKICPSKVNLTVDVNIPQTKHWLWNHFCVISGGQSQLPQVLGMSSSHLDKSPHVNRAALHVFVVFPSERLSSQKHKRSRGSLDEGGSNPAVFVHCQLTSAPPSSRDVINDHNVQTLDRKPLVSSRGVA